MKLFDGLYKVLGGEKQDIDFFNKRFRSVDERIHPLEEQRVSVDTEIERLRAITIEQVTAILSDAAAILEGFSSLGTILTVSTASSMAIETGAKVAIVALADRDKVPSGGYVTAKPVGVGDVQMSGFITFYNAETGELRFDATDVTGSGSYSDWIVGLAAATVESAVSASNVTVEEIEGLEAEDVQAAIAELKTQISDAQALAFAGL